MDDLLDRFFEQLEISLTQTFPRYIVKVSQVKGSFFFLVKKSRGKILNDDLKYLCDKVQYISANIYKKFAEDSKEFCYGFFPYFKLVKSYGNYHYHFLDIEKVMNMNENQPIAHYFHKPAEFNSVYFCPHFYKAFKKKYYH